MDFVYPNLLNDRIEFVEEVNDFILSIIPSQQETYLSYDTPCQSNEDEEV